VTATVIVIMEPPEKKVQGANSHVFREQRREVRSMEKRHIQSNRRSYLAMLKYIKVYTCLMKGTIKLNLGNHKLTIACEVHPFLR